MALSVGCPRCDTPVHVEVDVDGDRCVCPTHGPVPPLWRPDTCSYEDFGEHLLAAGSFPTWLPWPLAAGWRVSDFGRVGRGETRATMTRVTGTTDADGVVEFCVVSEEPGTGLGARCAGLESDPGPELGRGSPVAQVRLGLKSVPLWGLSTSEAPESDRTVLVGEGMGRWLWVVLTPASAVLMLLEELGLTDAARMGPSLLEVEFGEPGLG